MTLRHKASNVEEEAVHEESTAARGKFRDLVSLEDSDIEDFSSEIFAEEAL